MKRRKNGKLEALRILHRDADIVHVRKALDGLYGISHTDMARILGVSRGYVTQHIHGICHRHGHRNVRVEEGICRLWGGLPREEVFPDERE